MDVSIETSMANPVAKSKKESKISQWTIMEHGAYVGLPLVLLKILIHFY